MRHHRDSVLSSIRQHARSHGAAGSITHGEWYALKKSYGGVCLVCGATRDLVPDHVVALARGGSNTIDNIQPLCERCNAIKQTKSTDYRPGRQICGVDGIDVPEYVDDGFIVLEVSYRLWHEIIILAARTCEKPRDLLGRLAREEEDRLKNPPGINGSE